MDTMWSLLRNAFDTATKRSTKLALMIIIAHKSRLFTFSSDPDILGIYDRTKPIHDEYAGAWSDLVSAKSKRASAALDLRRAMKDLSKVKVPQWEAIVLGVFAEDSSEYKAIFNHGRLAFRNGNYNSRIATVDATSKVLKSYPALAALQTDVENTFKDLSALWDLKDKRKVEVEKAVDDLEIARGKVAEIMFGNFGFLLNKHYQNPSLVEKYFNVSLMRTHNGNNGNGGEEPQPVTGTVPANGLTVILAGGFDANSYFHITNTGNTLLKIYTAKLPDDPVPGSALELKAGVETDVFASELGASSNLFLMVYNPDEKAEGTYTFKVNEPEEV